MPLASPKCRTFIDVLEEKCATQPDATAYTFLGDDGAVAARLTFAEVQHRARAIAKQLDLKRARVPRGDSAPQPTAILLYPPGLDLVCAFYGCLYAGVIGVYAEYGMGQKAMVVLDKESLDYTA